MKVKVFFLGMLLGSALMFCSCNKVEEATTTDINVSSASIDLGEIEVDSLDVDTKSTAALRHFIRLTKTVTMDDIMNNEEAKKYASKIQSVTIDNTVITITLLGTEGTSVDNLRLTADGVEGYYGIDHYAIEKPPVPYTVNNTDAMIFLAKVYMKLFATNSVTLRLYATTNIPHKASVRVIIKVNDMRLKAKLL